MGLSLILLLVAAPCPGAEVGGVVAFHAGPFEGPATLSISLEPAAGQSAPRTAAERHRLAVIGGVLQPSHLAVHRGDRIQFVNHDSMRHSLRVVGGGADARLALGRAGEPEAAAELGLEQGATVHVFCTLHRQLYGRVEVLEDGHLQMLQAPGEFRFTGIAAGTWRLRVGSVSGILHEREVLAFTAPPAIAISIPAPAVQMRPVAEGFRSDRVEDLFPATRP